MKRFLIGLALLFVPFAGLFLVPFAGQAVAPAQVNGCQYNATPPALTDLQTVVFQCDATGALVVAGSAGGAALTVDLTKIAGLPVDVGPGTSGSATLRTILDSSQVTTLGTPGAPSSPTFTVQGFGLTNFLLEAAATDNHTVIKNGVGYVYHISVTNKSGAIQYLRLYNLGTGFNGCNSATGIIYEQEIPFQTSNVAGFIEDISQSLAFSTGISICYTGAFGQTDTTAATVSSSVINIGYK